MRRNALLVGVCLSLVYPGWVDAQELGNERVSVTSTETEADGISGHPHLSADGRFVVFSSDATNLTRRPIVGEQVFVRDRASGRTALVSIPAGGGVADSSSAEPAVSRDGRFVTFLSYATNMVGDEGSYDLDIFVRDRVTATTRRVSHALGGGEANGESLHAAISGNGRFIAFESVATNMVRRDNGYADIFVYDVETRKIQRVSESSTGRRGNGHSYVPAISGTGRYVAFESYADNLVAGDGNETADVFLHDRRTGRTRRLSVSSTGRGGNAYSMTPTISADGQVVSFMSDASNLVAGDSNGHRDIFVRDRRAGTTTRISLTRDGDQANGSSFFPVISPDGGFVVFLSEATNLLPGDFDGPDLFRVNRHTGGVRLVTRAGTCTDPEDTYGRDATVSRYGRFVGFQSEWDNLVADDNNGHQDVFVRDMSVRC